MSRPLRPEFAGAVYHLTARGNARGDIFADDEDRRMARILEPPQRPQDDRPSERHVGCGGVEPELHAERATEREFLAEPAIGDDLGGTGQQTVEISAPHGVGG